MRVCVCVYVCMRARAHMCACVCVHIGVCAYTLSRAHVHPLSSQNYIPNIADRLRMYAIGFSKRVDADLTSATSVFVVRVRSSICVRMYVYVYACVCM